MARFSKGSSISDVMTPSPRTLGMDATCTEGARAMRDDNVGAVLLTEGDELRGIVTDRDITVRAAAEGMDCASTSLGEIATTDPVTIDSSSSLEDAVNLMRDNDVRRIPVTEGGRPSGIISLGDIALATNAEPVLEEISSSPPNN
jgi:signal-transduction protein with cAMP-binding, CBS, and nucleotidyltransferase domain